MQSIQRTDINILTSALNVVQICEVKRMSDLISRSTLLESLIHCDGLGRKSLEAVIKTINEQPIVYGVEQVVKEIKEVGTRFCCVSVHCNNECSNCDHGAIMKAIIEIVKGGGVNG